MALIETTRSANVSNGGFAVMTTFFATLAKWNDARLTRKSLGKLTERQLNDIGLTRSDIDDIAQLTYNA